MCYAIKTVARTWEDAKAHCILEGGTLATVTSSGGFPVFS